MLERSPRCIKRGSPPTERNARTGLFTPPGILLTARSMSRAERSMVSIVLASTLLLPPPCKRDRTPFVRLLGSLYGLAGQGGERGYPESQRATSGAW